MGIKNLLDLLREHQVERPINIKEFAGCTIAVDTYCLLHRGALATVDRNAVQRDNGQYVRYVFKYVEMMLENGVKPLLVFDGLSLPAKSSTRQKRREQRETNRKKADEYRRAGEIERARSALMQAMEITSEMAYSVICECRARGVDYIVAPYEADAQLAYLNRQRIADAIWTVDADLLLFGCDKVIYNLDEYGRGLLYELTFDKLRRVCGLENSRFDSTFSFEHFRRMCILSGCDYLESPRGIGLKTARTIIQKAVSMNISDIRVILSRIVQLGGRSCQVESGYADAFIEAELTFLHQLVYCPLQRRLVPLTPYSASTSAALAGVSSTPTPAPLSPSKLAENRAMEFAGAYLSQQFAHWLAVGNVNVNTKQPVADAKFDPATNRSFLERVCNTLRERAEKFRRSSRSSVPSAQSQPQNSVVFSFEDDRGAKKAEENWKKPTKSSLSIWDPRFTDVLLGNCDEEGLQNLSASAFPLSATPNTFANRQSFGFGSRSAGSVGNAQTPIVNSNNHRQRSPLKRKLHAQTDSDVTISCSTSRSGGGDAVLLSYLGSKRGKLDSEPAAASCSSSVVKSYFEAAKSDAETSKKPNCGVDESVSRQTDGEFDTELERSPILVRRSSNLSAARQIPMASLNFNCKSNCFAVPSNEARAGAGAEADGGAQVQKELPEIGLVSRYFQPDSPAPALADTLTTPLPRQPPPVVKEKEKENARSSQSPAKAPKQQQRSCVEKEAESGNTENRSESNQGRCTSALSRFREAAAQSGEETRDKQVAADSSASSSTVEGNVNVSVEIGSESDSDVECVFVSPAPANRSVNLNASLSGVAVNAKTTKPASARSACRVSGLSRYRQTSASASRAKQPQSSSSSQQATLYRWLKTTPSQPAT